MATHPEYQDPDPDNPHRQMSETRRRLHGMAEHSGEERQTAALIASLLQACQPTELLSELGGHGVAAVFAASTGTAGPTVMLRAELDALPIPETIELPHGSRQTGCSHKCGHDGHMAVLLGVARNLAASPPARGRVVLLFQPAEETGTGAVAVVNDPSFAAIEPDWIFALHNLPGYAENTILIREGPFAAGSAGLVVRLSGRTAHAAYPEQAVCPDQALAELVPALVTLPIPLEAADELALVTVVHARLGERAFGTTPGEAEILATLRASDRRVLECLKESARELVDMIARNHGLQWTTEWTEEFPVVDNNPEAARRVEKVARALGLATLKPTESPFRWSEDFGHLASRSRGALFGLGAGKDHPVLHAPDYDFNDSLLEPGIAMLTGLARDLTD